MDNEGSGVDGKRGGRIEKGLRRPKMRRVFVFVDLKFLDLRESFKRKLSMQYENHWKLPQTPNLLLHQEFKGNYRCLN